MQAGHAVLADGEQLFVLPEFTEFFSLALRADYTGNGVEVEDLRSERAHSCAHLFYRLDRVFCHDVSERIPSLDLGLRKIDFEIELYPRTRLEDDLDRFRFAVRVRGNVEDFRPRFSLAHRIVLVAGDAADVEPLDESRAVLAVLVDDVVDSPFVVLVELFDQDDVLADEVLVGNLDYLVGTVRLEDDDVVVFRNVEEIFLFL